MSASSGGTSSSDDDHLPRGLPKRQRRRRGWEGEEMELQRDDAPTGDTHAAVDLQQFRNTEVGKGYQAKHVVRQRTGMESRDAVKVQDMTTSSTTQDMKEQSRKSSKKSKKRKKHKNSSSPSSIDQDDRKQKKSTPEDFHDERLQRYLKCDGLRQFRRELESIVRSS